MAVSTGTSREAEAVVSREQVLAYRFSASQLDRARSDDVNRLAMLNLGVQDTGPDGAGWALVNRGATPDGPAAHLADLVLAWTLRGAPHAYRRADIAQVATATAPFSSVDAAKRIFDAARSLRAAGIDITDALDTIAAQLRDIVREPMVKGTVSAELTARLDPPYLRHCRPCNATHTYEQPFRLAALRAGLELQPGTSPPVLQRIPGWKGRAKQVAERLDVVRSYLHLLGPATPKQVAAYVDAPVTEIKARWPHDCVALQVNGERRWLLQDDLESLLTATVPAETVRLLGPYDLFLQAKDRDLLVPDPVRRKELWPVLGRPGAVVAGGEIIGTWRPKATGRRLKLALQLASTRAPQLDEQAERLTAYRGFTFAGFHDERTR